MQRYLLRRTIGLVPSLFGISVFVFLMIHLIPGDPIAVMMGRTADPEALAAVRARYGLDRPLPVQYLSWLGDAVQGDFGSSIRTDGSVLKLVADRMPPTLYLMIGGMLVTIALAGPIGVAAAARHNTWVDLLGTTVTFALMSIPSFWFAILLILLLSVKFGILPATGYVPPSEDFTAFLKSMIMPCLALGAGEAGFIARLLRSSMLDTLGQDYINVARAKGVRERRVLRRHAIPNALIPVLTVVALEIGYLLGGAIIIERVFAYPGMGLLLIDAVSSRDYPLIQGAVLILALLFLLINLLTDVLYAVVDPRIRYG